MQEEGVISPCWSKNDTEKCRQLKLMIKIPCMWRLREHTFQHLLKDEKSGSCLTTAVMEGRTYTHAVDGNGKRRVPWELSTHSVGRTSCCQLLIIALEEGIAAVSCLSLTVVEGKAAVQLFILNCGGGESCCQQLIHSCGVRTSCCQLLNRRCGRRTSCWQLVNQRSDERQNLPAAVDPKKETQTKCCCFSFFISTRKWWQWMWTKYQNSTTVQWLSSA